MINKIKELTENVYKEAVLIRRQLHSHPELGFKEYETSKLIADKLKELGIEIEQGYGRTGVIGLIRGQKKNFGPVKTIALRADMDALPVKEESDCEFKSLNNGIMHACGHDAHTSILLGAAQVLNSMKEEFAGNIKLIFQPCEEGSIEVVDGATEGAKCLINEGVLENPKVDGILGLHVDPFLESGIIGYREGPIFAGMATFDIEIKGIGGHAAQPHETIDSIVIAAEVVQALQTIRSRRISPLEPFLLSIGTIEGGTKRNIIAESVKMSGTVRSFSQKTHEKTAIMMEKLIKDITSANDAQYSFKYNNELCPLVNDVKLTKHVKKCAEEIFGSDNVVEADRTMIGEDFALFAALIPGSFIRLGVGDINKENYPLHHPKFHINEDSISNGIEILSYAALSYLKKE